MIGMEFVSTGEVTVGFTQGSTKRLVPGTVLTASQIVVFAPFGSAGMANLSVALNGQQFVSSGVTSFMYYSTWFMLYLRRFT